MGRRAWGGEHGAESMGRRAWKRKRIWYIEIRTCPGVSENTNSHSVPAPCYSPEKIGQRCETIIFGFYHEFNDNLQFVYS
jgi:hypothetical protein